MSLPTLLLRSDNFRAVHFDSGSGGTYHARAMGNTLRDRRTPLELAASGQVIEFSEKIFDWTLINSRPAGAIR